MDAKGSYFSSFRLINLDRHKNNSYLFVMFGFRQDIANQLNICTTKLYKFTQIRVYIYTFYCFYFFVWIICFIFPANINNPLNPNFKFRCFYFHPSPCQINIVELPKYQAICPNFSFFIGFKAK